VLPAFLGEPFERRQPLFWEWRGLNDKNQAADWPQLAMRDGFYTLLMKHDGSRVELYDLAQDRGQENDLAAAQPERVANMTKVLRAWQKTLPVTTPPPTRSRRKARPAKSSRPAADRTAVFKKWDKNADNILTLEEYTNGLSKKANAAQRFQNFDKNGDGHLTHDEFLNTNPHAGSQR
jgi:N-acetylgalactosamine-6-sulfatase